MATIETTDDLIRLLRQDEEFRAAARREILTQELLRLPALFADFKVTTEMRLAALESDVGILKDDVNTLKGDVKVLKQDVKVLKQDVKVLKSDVDSLKGFALEGRLQTKALARIVGALDLRRARIIRMTTDSRGGEDFSDALWDARHAGILSEDERTRILETDLIVRGERHSARGRDVYIATEASFTSNGGDLTRARQSAQALGRVFPEAEVIAALYFDSISEQDLEAARAAGAIAIADN